MRGLWKGKIKMIYIIRIKGTETVKIGFTKNELTLKTRIKSLETGCHQTLKVEATMPGSKLKERCMHSFCVSRHLRGEWFRLSSDEVSRMIEKYRHWTPTSAGISKMSDIRHTRRRFNQAKRQAWH